MSDDLEKKISQITELLSQESMPDSVKTLLTLLTGSGGDSADTQETDRSGSDISHEDAEMVRKIKKIVNATGRMNDPNINLLNAIKPFLNQTRQKKLDSFLTIFQMTRMKELFDENGLTEKKGV